MIITNVELLEAGRETRTYMVSAKSSQKSVTVDRFKLLVSRGEIIIAPGYLNAPHAHQVSTSWGESVHETLKAFHKKGGGSVGRMTKRRELHALLRDAVKIINERGIVAEPPVYFLKSFVARVTTAPHAETIDVSVDWAFIRRYTDFCVSVNRRGLFYAQGPTTEFVRVKAESWRNTIQSIAAMDERDISVEGFVAGTEISHATLIHELARSLNKQYPAGGSTCPDSST